MKPDRCFDVGPALFGGYRVALMCGLRCDGQALFDTANDVAACAALLGMPVATCDESIIAACQALGESTARELAYAQSLGKRVRYWSEER